MGEGEGGGAGKPISLKKKTLEGVIASFVDDKSEHTRNSAKHVGGI